MSQEERLSTPLREPCQNASQTSEKFPVSLDVILISCIWMYFIKKILNNFIFPCKKV